MIRSVITIILLSLSFLTARGLDLSYDPSPYYTITRPLTQGWAAKVNIINNSTLPVQLRWKLVENSLLSGWDASICDYDNCYVGIPDSGAFAQIAGEGGTGYFILNFTPNVNTGTGFVKLKVYEAGNENDADTVIYEVSAFNPVGIPGVSGDPVINLYPNPAVDYISIESESNQISRMEILNLIGQTIMVSEPKSSHVRINLLGWDKGTYYISLRMDNDAVLARKFVIR